MVLAPHGKSAFFLLTHHPCLGFLCRRPHSDHGDLDTMTNAPRKAFPARIPLLEFLLDHGWKPLRDNGSDEVAGLCPLHRDTRPSFYVNRRKQVFYCHGCGCGGGLSRLTRLLGDSADPLVFPLAGLPSEQLLEDTLRFLSAVSGALGECAGVSGRTRHP
jgi:hypothetical protein